MSEVNSVQVDPRNLSIFKKMQTWLMPNDGREPKTVLTISDTDTMQDLFAKLQQYSIETLRPSGTSQAAVAAVDENDPSVYIIEARYNEQQLTILEDCYVSDLVVFKLVNKLMYSIAGPHGKTVLDTRIEFTNERERSKEIARISKIPKWQKIKAQIDDLFTEENIDFHASLGDLIINYFVFGRACWYIQKDPITGKWLQIILLDSKRIGRVKVDKISRKVTAVEYLDVEVNPETGEMTPAIQLSQTAQTEQTQTTAAFLDAKNLIYVPFTAGGIGRNTRYTGYSLLEPLIHMSQVKRIVINKNLKEAAETHYMGFGRYQFDPNTPDSIITNFINSVKGATGKFFAHKVPVQSFIEKIAVDLEKYNAAVDLLNREMIRASGLASFLFGYEQIANYANSEQVNLAAREMDISAYKTTFKDIIAHKILKPLTEIFNKITTNEEPVAANTAADIVNNTDMTGEPTQAITTTTPTPQDENQNDDYIKIVYEFQDLNFNTKKEAAETIKIVKELVPALPVEAILRTVGLNDWVEETLAEIEKQDKEKKQRQQDALENLQAAQQQQGQGQPPQQPPQEGAQQSGPFGRPLTNNPAAVAAMLEDPELKPLVMDLIRTQTAMYEEIRQDVNVKRNKTTV